MTPRFLPTIKDSADRESHTLLFVTIAFVVVTVKMLIAGVDLSSFGLGKAQAISLTEYATSVAAVMAVWLGREWIRKP